MIANHVLKVGILQPKHSSLNYPEKPPPTDNSWYLGGTSNCTHNHLDSILNISILIYILVSPIYMPNTPTGLGGSTLSAPLENIAPILGQKIILSWEKYAGIHGVPEGAYMRPNGTYIEVVVTAIKTAKVILE